MSSEPVVEWRSIEQVENGIASTSPSLWDTDDDDECGPKAFELYGKFTWKIDKFSQINKRELRSDEFEVGGYQWYILIYPQGCDVCNHLSLFLCIANHDKLLPGWSQFAQFTIAVENKDPKNNKYSDTLHRFWKKEHDWGWKKFMELSKVLDGFVDCDTLVINAQVQVIRERADRPFRCLNSEYRRELVRVYLTNVEQICRRFVEERRSKLGKLIEDKARWSSFCAFWLGTDQNSRHQMSKEKTEVILKVVVKHFFIEKEVTSTLVMDSLYSGLKALEDRTKSKKANAKLSKTEEMPVPLVRVERDTFVLVDDVLSLFKRASVEPLPPRVEKGPQNRIKDICCGEDFNNEAIERDERRLTELGRRTIEILALVHIFSKIEAAYLESVALKRQEELIREEEAWLAETLQKANRGAREKEKKSKKKQGKQKRNNHKGKDKGRNEKIYVAEEDDIQQESHAEKLKDFHVRSGEHVLEKPDGLRDVSDMSDSADCVRDVLQIDSFDRDASPVNWDTDTSEVHPPTEGSSKGISGVSSVRNGGESKSPSLMDDSSSTCSTDSVPSVVINGPYKGNSVPNRRSQKSPNRRNQRVKVLCDENDWGNDTHSWSSVAVGKPREEDQIKRLEQHVVKKAVVGQQKKPNIKDKADGERSSKEKPKAVPTSPTKVLVTNPSPNSPQKTDKASLLANSSEIRPSSDEPNVPKSLAPKPSKENPKSHQIPTMSRPLSAPLIPGSKPTAPVVSTLRTAPTLARSVSSVGRLGPDPSAPSTQGYVPPRSYRNAIVGNMVSASSSTSHSEPLAYVSTPSISSSSEGVDANSISPGFSVGKVNPDAIQNGSQGTEGPQIMDLHAPDLFPRRPTQVVAADEFPHLDIINDLLDDENADFRAVQESPGFGSFSNRPHYLNRQFSFPGDIITSSAVCPTIRSCRFDRSQSYCNDGYQWGGYGTSVGSFESLQADQRPYFNRGIEGLVTSAWPMDGSNLPFLTTRHHTEGDIYPYHQIPEYSDLACGVNGYNVFGPSNGY